MLVTVAMFIVVVGVFVFAVVVVMMLIMFVLMSAAVSVAMVVTMGAVLLHGIETIGIGVGAHRGNSWRFVAISNSS